MRVTFLFLLIGIVSLFLASTALASRVDVTVKDTATAAILTTSNPLSVCPSPITPKQVSILVKNLGATTDTYKLNVLSKPDGWNVILQNEITLAAAREEKVNLLLVNMPSPFSVQPGPYKVVIEARSLSSSDNDQAEIPVQVLACNAVEVKAVEQSQSICQETGGSKIYSLEIKNAGRFPETFSLSSSASWASLSKTSVMLQPGQKEVISATLTPPSSLRGQQKVKVTAASQSSYAKAEAELTLDVKDCFTFEATLQPKQNQACLGGTADYDLEILNRGDEDTFSIELPQTVSAQEKQVTILSSGRKKIPLIVTPSKKGIISFDVTVSSSKGSESKKVSGTVDAQECRSVAVIISPSTTTACTGDKMDFIVTMKNTGKIKDTYVLSSTKGTLEKNDVTLEPSETKTVKLSVDTKTLSKEEIISVTATSGSISDSSKTIVTLENCYEAAVQIVPSTVQLCPSSEQEFTITLENKGKLGDTYTLTYENNSERVTLAKGGKKQISLKKQLPLDSSGTQSVTARAVSDHADVSASSVIRVKSRDACFGVKLSNGQHATVGELEGAVIPVKVKNTGEIKQLFTVSLDGPSWITFSPNTLELDAGQTGEVYVYASPPFGTKKDRYTATVTSRSQYTTSSYDLSVVVGQDGATVTTPSPEPQQPPATVNNTNNNTGSMEGKKEEGSMKENKSAPGITLSVTFENITGELTKKVQLSPSVKTIAIGIITIIIIIILIVRFAILVK